MHRLLVEWLAGSRQIGQTKKKCPPKKTMALDVSRTERWSRIDSSVHLRNGVRSNFVSVGVQVLDLAVVGPFVGHVKCARDRTSVGIDSTRFKQVAVKFFV